MVDKPIFEIGTGLKDSVPLSPGLPHTGPNNPFLGKMLVVTPHPERGSNQFINLNFTGPPGSCSGLYYSLVFQFGKWNFNVVKVDEWIEVSPEYGKYYQETMAQKQALEATIKTGLSSAAQAVADYELLNHDLRKYKEILEYFRQKTEHSLKAMFIDQVDIHTGDGISMRSIVSRWPTIISDFIKLKDEDDDPDKIAKRLDVSKAEGVILTTKNKLYKEWKTIFKQVAIDRYNHLKSLVESRRKSVEEYRKWLKPYVARFKMMRTGAERPEVVREALRSYVDLTGQATFGNSIRLWAWRKFKVPEIRKFPVERVGKFVVPPDDDFIKEMFILNPKWGLASIYPWLLEKKNEKTVAEEMIDEILSKEWNSSNALDPEVLYYIFFDINIFRAGSRTPGFEAEDITFDIKTNMLSQNAMLVKFLELKCREREMERYVDEILGVSEEAVKKDYPELFAEEKKAGMKIAMPQMPKFPSFAETFKPFKTFTMPGLVKPGLYEKDFNDRIPRLYLIPMGSVFADVKNFLKNKMGMV